MSAKRSVVQFYFDQGYSTPEIVRLLKKEKISKQFVYYTIQKLRDTGSIQDRKRTGRPRTVRTPELQKKIRRILKKNPQRSLNKLSQKLNISDRSLRRVVHEDLGLKTYKKRKHHGLNVAQRKKRVDRCRMLLRRFKKGDEKSIVFSDEKLFVVEEKWNAQNSRVYAAKIEDIPETKRTVIQSQKPGSLMIWAAVSSYGKFPLKFIEPRVKINADYYRHEILERVVEPSGRRMFKNQPWVFQQDSAPAHKAKVNQAWCQAHLPWFISTEEWPPSSPDLNPLDYTIWGLLEARVNSTTHRSLESLRRAIRREWLKLELDEICSSINCWRERLTKVVKQRGGYIE